MDETSADTASEPSVPAAEVEPLLSLEQFCLTQTLRPHARAALHRYVQMQGLAGHYALPDWQALYQEMLAHTG